jgi:2-aminoethylphosphonate-pyruvate transaminase
MKQMVEFTPENRYGHRVLLTPGPLTTTATVRAAMQEDIGTWDDDAIELVREIRETLVELADGPAGSLTCTLMQGCGSMGVECVLGSAIPRNGGKVLILNNGAYGIRMIRSCQALGIPFVEMLDPEEQAHDPARVEDLLAHDPSMTHVAAVHCETTTGLVNPLREIGLAVARQKRRLIVDAISSFGAYSTGRGGDIDFEAGPIDHLVGSSNKCVEGVPGFSFIISRRAAVAETAGNARSFAMDLHSQWNGFETRGKFRFTPPTHVLMAFRQALRELRAEGGIPAREHRYKENRDVLIAGMRRLGFEPLIPAAIQSHIITTFLFPDASFDFDRFYRALREHGYIIYPGKLTHRDTFRIGNIGSIGRWEIEGLLGAIAKVCGK